MSLLEAVGRIWRRGNKIRGGAAVSARRRLESGGEAGGAAWQSCGQSARRGKRAMKNWREPGGKAGRLAVGRADQQRPNHGEGRRRPISVGRGGRRTVGGLDCKYIKVQGLK